MRANPASTEALPDPPNRWCRWRRGIQALALLFFVLLTLSLRTPWPTVAPHDLFLRLDLLLWLVGSLATREIAAHAFFALALLLITALLGRVFCGWICPLGTLMDATRAAVRSGPGRALSRRWASLRFALLGVLIGAALLDFNLAGWLDPIATPTRALHLAHTVQGSAWPAAMAWALLLGAIGLTLIAPRFWCRLLCPLGAALSLVSRFSPWGRRLTDSCRRCGACAPVCPMGGSPSADPGEDCLICGRCAAVCPEGVINLGWRRFSGKRDPDHVPPMDRSRRRLLFGLGGLTAGGMLGLKSSAARSPVPLRPPGAAPEESFVARCIGCGACLAVCPTRGLVPMLRWDRLEAAFSPEFVPRFGPCLPVCTACGMVCPTGAIPRIAPGQKGSARIGVAVIDTARCLPWARQERCVICLDACPPEFRAIELRRMAAGPFRPYVLEERCTGCGICEHRCPVQAPAAVRVVPVTGQW